VPTDSVGRPRRPPPAAPGSLRVEPRPSSMAGKPKRPVAGVCTAVRKLCPPRGPQSPTATCPSGQGARPLEPDSDATRDEPAGEPEGGGAHPPGSRRRPINRQTMPTACRLGAGYEAVGTDHVPGGAGLRVGRGRLQTGWGRLQFGQLVLGEQAGADQEANALGCLDAEAGPTARHDVDGQVRV
jgi:hypothetical protein